MAYRYDPDLEFLKELSSEELDGLVKILTLDKEGDSLLTENLTFSKKYKRYYPNHHSYWDEIAEELQLFGGNTIMTLLKGNKGVLYKEILCDVCDRLKVNYNKKAEVSLIEQYLLTKVLQDSLEKMSSDELKKLAVELGIKNIQVVTPQAMAAAFLSVFRAGGLRSYQLTFIVVNSIMQFLFGRTLPIVANKAVIPTVGILSGPIGLAITTLLTVLSFSGPAYRVTIPAVFEVIYLRSLAANRKEKEPSDINKKIKSELYDPSKTNFDLVLKLLHSSKEWDDTEKENLLKTVLYSRTGMDGWDYIGPDSPKVIFELATTPKLREVYQIAINLYPDSKNGQELTRILNLAQQKMKRWENPIYNLSQKPSVIFKDLGLKLAVINQLMYEKDELKPKVVQDLFIDEFSQYLINPNCTDYYKAILFGHCYNISFDFPKKRPLDSYMIPEVREYFVNLDIPQSLLDKIDVVHITKDNELYQETVLITDKLSSNEDNLIQIDEKTIADLDLLPNLKYLYITECAVLSDKFINEIKSRDINLVIVDKNSTQVS